MSYLGLIKPLCESYLTKIKHPPKVLEIGIHYGQSAIPLIHNLSVGFDEFLYVGIDILVRPEPVEQIVQMKNISVAEIDGYSGRDVVLFQQNSLDWLSLQVANKSDTKYDIVFIDGDHNYYTVMNELNFIQHLVNPDSIIVCDDYSTRWGDRDLFYSQRDGYSDIEIATPFQASDKKGLKSAINDFVNLNPMWSGWCYRGTDPIILYRNDIWEKLNSDSDSDCLLKDAKFNFKLLEKR